MDFYKRPASPFLQVSFRNPVTDKTERRSTGQTTKAAAQKWFALELAKLQKTAEETVGGLQPITLRAALEAYASDAKARRLSAAGGYSATMQKTLGLEGRWGLDGSRWLHSLTPIDLQDLRTHRRAEGMSEQTIVHELILLRAASRMANSLGYRAPPMVNSTVKNAWGLPKLTQKTRFLTAEEWQHLYDYLSPDKPMLNRGATYVPGGKIRRDRQDVQDLLVCLTLCGGRWNEVAGMRWEQVTPEGIRIFGEKTDRERWVPIAPMVAAMMNRRMAERDPKVPWVFPGAKGQRRHEAGSCQPILRAMNALGFNAPELVERHGRCVVHSLRHTYASWLAMADADLADIKDTLGHANVSTTMRYRHHDGVKTASRLAALLGDVSRKGPL